MRYLVLLFFWSSLMSSGSKTWTMTLPPMFSFTNGPYSTYMSKYQMHCNYSYSISQYFKYCTRGDRTSCTCLDILKHQTRKSYWRDSTCYDNQSIEDITLCVRGPQVCTIYMRNTGRQYVCIQYTYNCQIVRSIFAGTL